MRLLASKYSYNLKLFCHKYYNLLYFACIKLIVFLY
uniref:Uncharacterized protein n=1 Tax=Siphoviridae sp. ctuUw41 TaxID=2826503 RepID=A0A8S5MXW9_9CAUD|nr:MAG TPA: hypothetical protein [Siphoviridae sp. ctuUw41]